MGTAEHLKYSVSKEGMPSLDQKQWLQSTFGLSVTMQWSWHPMQILYGVSCDDLTRKERGSIVELFLTTCTAHPHAFTQFRNMLAIFSANVPVVRQLLEILADGKVELYHVVQEGSLFDRKRKPEAEIQ